MHAKMSAASNVLAILLSLMEPSGKFNQSLQTIPTTTSEVAQHVSILEIALNCSHFEGRRVTVLGAVALGFENRTICPTRGFLEADPLNCLWLATDESWPESEAERIAKTIDKGDYLVIDGRVSCKRGHLSLFGGTLRDIRMIIHNLKSEVLWDTESQIRKD